MMFGLRLMLLFIVMLALTGCPGPNYAPYNNMTNSYGWGWNTMTEAAP
jgi:hypothetical protein